MELNKQIAVVAQMRQKVNELQEQKQVKMELWEIENKEMLEDITVQRVLLEESEDTLRDMTITVFNETGNKHPAKGVNIREVTTYSYDGTEALKWAVEHKMALKLDEPEFKAIAKAKMKTDPLPFVTSVTKPQATIATDLDAVIKGEDNAN